MLVICSMDQSSHIKFDIPFPLMIELVPSLSSTSMQLSRTHLSQHLLEIFNLASAC